MTTPAKNSPPHSPQVYSRGLTKLRRGQSNKKPILEDALRMCQAEYIRKRVAESYRTASKDAEMTKLANAGLSDWGAKCTALDQCTTKTKLF